MCGSTTAGLLAKLAPGASRAAGMIAMSSKPTAAPFAQFDRASSTDGFSRPSKLSQNKKSQIV